VVISVTPTAHGAAALDALAAAVRAAKGGDPLQPVAVIVPTNTAGVMARRALGRRGGAAAIDVLTLYRVAELLGAPSLLDEGRKPVSTPVVDLAVKQVLARDAGPYGAVAHHPSTIVALRDLYRELRLAGAAAITVLGERSRASARITRDVARTLAARWYDEADLLERAAATARAGRAERLARAVVFLPQRLSALAAELVGGLGTHGSVELIVGLTGDAESDAAMHELVGALTGRACPAARTVEGGGAVTVVSTTDADDEVHNACRVLLDGAREGVPFDRMAMLWPTDRPYARLVEHQLAAAGIPWNGRPGTRLAERVVPRVLAELLQLDRRGLRRSALMSLLADVPARDASGRVVPTARWERIGRRAGIIREDDWRTRLPLWIEEARRRESTDVLAAQELLEFVATLRRTLGEPTEERAWSAWVEWSGEQLERWFGPGGLDRLDGAERLAWEQTQRVLDRLRHLDSIGPAVTRAEFRATFEAELDVTPAREGKVGDGVYVGALAGSTGIDVDVVVVLGAADGLLPPPPPTDPLLGDGDRAAAGLVTADERVAVAHRHFLAATTTTRRVVITVPRGDLRATTMHHQSRWLDELRAQHDVDVTGRVVDSHAHGVLAAMFPVSPAEHRVRELWARVRSGDDLREHPLAVADEVLSRALQLREARASDTLTVYDGDVSSREITTLRDVVAPTTIEQWPQCPHAFFVQHVLGVRPIDEPEDIMTISALDRGSAVHAIVHRLQRAVLDGELVPPGAHGWDRAHVAALDRYCAAVADELEVAGRTGRAAYWANARRELHDELRQWIDAERAAWSGRTVRESERSFGDPPVEVAIPGGRTIAFKGQIDRVDELPDGTIVVTDHKTGGDRAYRSIAPDDPTAAATRFQLPVYAAAARQLLSRPDADVRAEYAFFGKAKFVRIGLDLDDATFERVGHDLAHVVAGIESGLFPARPDPPSWTGWVACEFCDPDHLGTAERWAEWDRKRHDPRLARWFADDDAAAAEPVRR
jgi:RecB family exonuclease